MYKPDQPLNLSLTSSPWLCKFTTIPSLRLGELEYAWVQNLEIKPRAIWLSYNQKYSSLFHFFCRYGKKSKGRKSVTRTAALSGRLQKSLNSLERAWLRAFRPEQDLHAQIFPELHCAWHEVSTKHCSTVLIHLSGDLQTVQCHCQWVGKIGLRLQFYTIMHTWSQIFTWV